MDNSAVTVQVGMILILMIISISMGLIFANYRGIAESMIGLNHEKELRNSITLLHANLEKVVFGDVSSRTTELKTYEGYFSIQNNSYIKIGNTTLYLGELLYRDETRNFSIVIENGAVFTVYAGKTLITEYPKAYSTGNTSLIPAIQIEGTGSTSGKGVLRIRMENHGGGIFTTKEDILIHSEYAVAWKKILEGYGFNVTLINSSEILIKNDGEFVVKSAIISVELLR